MFLFIDGSVNKSIPVWYDAEVKSLFQKLTFKRFVIIFLVIVFSLPILKSVFWENDGKTHKKDGYEYTYLKGDENSQNIILQISINGVILTESTGVAGPLDFLTDGVTYGYEIKESFRRAAENEEVKAVLLTINSPGGTIPGSQAISEGIELYKRETGNTVYAHIRDVGASGAYWAAASTDRIYIDKGSLTGSIGVLMGPFTYYDKPFQEGSILGGVTTENGIEHMYITGGQYKDTGSPYRRMTPEEIVHWQESVNNEYTVFVDHVSRERSLSPDFIRNTVKALPYDSIQAKNLNLVDVIAGEDVAIADLADASGLGDDYQVLYEKSTGDFFSQLFSAFLKTEKPQAYSTVCSLCNTPLYLYDRTYSIFNR